MAGTALIQVIDRRLMRPQKPLRWKRSSRTRLELATNAESTHDLGVDVEERERVEATVLRTELQVRRHAGCGVQQLVLAQADDLGRSVVPEEESTTPPAPARCGAVAPGRVTRPSSS